MRLQVHISARCLCLRQAPGSLTLQAEGGLNVPGGSVTQKLQQAALVQRRRLRPDSVLGEGDDALHLLIGLQVPR